MNNFVTVLQPVNVNQLTTWEDHIAAWQSEEEKEKSAAWGKADILYSLWTKFGEDSIEKFATQIGYPRTTVHNYLKTAEAFPPAKRLPFVSFTHHMKVKGVSEEKQTIYLEEAADNNWSVAKLGDKISEDKRREESDTGFLECYICWKSDEDVMPFTIFGRHTDRERLKSDKFDLHEGCYLVIKQLIEQERERNHGN